MKKLFLSPRNGMLLAAVFCSCSHDFTNTLNTEETLVVHNNHSIKAFHTYSGKDYVVIFESGLGDGHENWNTAGIVQYASAHCDVVTYDRAGYGSSAPAPGARNIEALSSDLEAVIERFSGNRKIILAGHSLGGMIIRDFAIRNPQKVAAILFVDPSHENYNLPTQEEEDLIFNFFKDEYGEIFGGTAEARELIEDSAYMATLPNLPDVPVTVITSMKTDEIHTAEDRQQWYASHQSLGNGISDFRHMSSPAGHYVMMEDPLIVQEALGLLISKVHQD